MTPSTNAEGVVRPPTKPQMLASVQAFLHFSDLTALEWDQNERDAYISPVQQSFYLFLLHLLQAVSRLHPECEFIFQLEREERRCLQYVAEQGNRSSEGGFALVCIQRVPFRSYETYWRCSY